MIAIRRYVLIQANNQCDADVTVTFSAHPGWREFWGFPRLNLWTISRFLFIQPTSAQEDITRVSAYDTRWTLDRKILSVILLVWPKEVMTNTPPLLGKRPPSAVDDRHPKSLLNCRLHCIEFLSVKPLAIHSCQKQTNRGITASVVKLKIASTSKENFKIFIGVFCGDRTHWVNNQLELFRSYTCIYVYVT